MYYCCTFLSILDRTDANDLSLTPHRKSPFERARTKSSSPSSLVMPQIETKAERLRKRAQEGLALLRANANAGVPAKREMVGRKDRGKEAPLEGGCESGCTSIGLHHSGMSGELAFLSVSCGKSDLRAPAGNEQIPDWSCPRLRFLPYGRGLWLCVAVCQTVCSRRKEPCTWISRWKGFACPS